MTAKQIIANNDMETAIEKFESANSRWRNHWWETIVEIYNSSKEWAKKYVIDPINQIISGIAEKVRKVRSSKYDSCINWVCENVNYPVGSELVYLIRMLDENDNLVYSKVGTTTRSMRQRMAEHLRYYKKEGITKILIDRVYNCGEYEAEGLESVFRGKYIKEHKRKFKKNDRFIETLFDLEDADRIYAEFMA